MRGIGDNKKGQQMTLSTIIAIVLGIAVLVFLIFGFSSGWTNLWDRVVNIGGGTANLGTIKQSCEIACGAQDKDNYCSFKRTVKFGEEVKNIAADCGKDGKTNAKTCYATCFELAGSRHENITKVGFPSCPSLGCQ